MIPVQLVQNNEPDRPTTRELFDAKLEASKNGELDFQEKGLYAILLGVACILEHLEEGDKG